MGKFYLLKLIRVIFIFIILSLSHTNVFAKSTDEKKFLKLLSEAINLRDQNNQSTIKTYKIIKKINKEFDVANINIDNITKANFYILRCDGSELFNEDDRQKIINYCLESDAFNIKNKIYKENNYEIVEVLFAFIIAEQASIDFTYSNNKDNLKIAKKYIEKNLKLKNSKKYKNYYASALIHLTSIYRAEQKINKAIETQKLYLNTKECFNNLIKKKKSVQTKCNKEKINLSVLLLDSGNENNRNESFKILTKLLENEKKDDYNFDNRQHLRVILSTHYQSQGNFKLAEKYIIESISLLKSESGKKELYFLTLEKLYFSYYTRGLISEAKTGLEKLISDIKLDLGKDNLILVSPLSSLMKIYSLEEEGIHKAVKIQKQLIQILNKNPNSFYNAQATYGNIASVYVKLNNFKEAEKYWIKAIKSSTLAGNNLMMPLAYTKLSLNKVEEAEKIIESFIPITSLEKISLVVIKDILYSGQKKIHKYKNNFIDFYLIFSSLSKGLLPNISKEDLNFHAGNISFGLNNLTNLSKKDFKIFSNYFKKETNKTIESATIELFEIIKSSKLNERVKNIIDRSTNPIVEDDKKKLQDLVIAYEKLPKISNNEIERKKNIKNLILIKNKISKQKEIIVSKLNILSISNNLNDILLSDIQNEINKDQAIISYLIDQDLIYILCITNDNFVIKKKNISNKKITELISEVIKSVKISGTGKLNKFDFTNSKKIYDIILKPVENIILKKNELIIIPHKSLLSLPIEILVPNTTKATNSFNYSNVDWIGKKFAISYYPSIYSFYNLKKINFVKAKYSFLGLGNPDLSSSNKAVTKKMDYSKLMSRGIANSDEIRKMNNLPETADELNFIANIFKKNSKLYLGKDFNETKIKSLDLSNYRFISFATHAVIANQINNIAEPGLILTPPKKSTKDNDGILTVTEIEKLNLNSDIVILSACNTASNDGSPNGEGLSGLTSAFFQAGTKSMLVTHWDVETNSAVKLTTGALSKYYKETNLSAALQKTKIEMISNDETSHPFFWAPFTLIGNIQGN